MPQAYAREGEAALSRLRGSFVVAIVDGARGRAMLARDPMGSHPLFYAEAGGVLASCSPRHPGDCLIGLVCHASSMVRPPIISVTRWPDPHETFFKAVRRVPAGTRAVLSKGRLQFDRYWHPAPVGRPLQWLTPEEASGFDDVFDRAVKRCLNYGQVGIFLSGGLDSISVGAVAGRLRPRKRAKPATCVVTRISGPRMQRARASGGRCTPILACASTPARF